MAKPNWLALLTVPAVLTSKVGSIDETKLGELLSKANLPIQPEHVSGLLAILKSEFPPEVKVYDALPQLATKVEPLLSMYVKQLEHNTEQLDLVRCPHCAKAFSLSKE